MEGCPKCATLCRSVDDPRWVELNLRRFVTMVVDHENKGLMEVVHGKGADELRAALDHLPGRENVRWVALDMSDAYRSFARDFFPNARLV